MGHATTVTAAALARALDASRDTLISRWKAAYEGDRRAIHRGRVASRRWREVLAVVIAALSRSGAAELRREVRRVTPALGPVREIDVAIEVLGDAAKRHARPAEETERVQAQLESLRLRRRTVMRARLSKIDASWLSARGEDVVAALEGTSTSDSTWRRMIGQRLARRSADVEAALASCGTMYMPDRLHAVRIAVKKLRYALEVARLAGQPDLGRTIAGLRRAQGDFGHLHDAQVLVEHLRGLAIPRRRGRRGRPGARLVDALELECRTWHARILRRVGTIDRLARKAGETARAMQRAGRPSMAKFTDLHRSRPAGVAERRRG